MLVAAVATVWIVWGSTFLGIRVMVETIPPMVGSGVRFLLGGALLVLLVMKTAGPRAYRLTAEQWRGSAALGLLLVAGGVGLFAIAEHGGLPSSLAALIASSEAALVLALRVVAGRERISSATAFGVGVGAVGVILLLLPGSRPEGIPMWTALVGVAGSITWASGTYLGSRLQTAPSLLVNVSIQMLAGGLVLLTVGLLVGEQVHPGAFSTRSLVALGSLVVASVAVYVAYGWLIRNASLSLVTTQAYVNPVVAVALGVLVANETLGGTAAIGMAITLVAVALTLRAERHGAGHAGEEDVELAAPAAQRTGGMPAVGVADTGPMPAVAMHDTGAFARPALTDTGTFARPGASDTGTIPAVGEHRHR
ncbi:EamA family transporter [Patulibacter sp. SYSU D01012]|uniref:EamA family transporter n=1 Tax=Patulibacter sp. SYSU D01012 TaxID=2817381 RepID=UPI001B30B669